jgi:ABC-type dipeptide/oligopeptide/nickel transport system permease component
MAKFVIRRVLWTIPVILLVIFLTFVLMRQIKGNPFQNSERAVPVSVQRNLNRKFHLDKPWPIQFAYYVEGVFTFDLGPSLVQRDQSVNDIVREHFPKSVELGTLAMLFAILIGVPVGIISALKQNTIVDYLAMGFSNVGFALPSFFVATIFSYVFALKLGSYTHLPTFGWDWSWSGWKTWVLPATALGLFPLTYFARLVRGTMLETLQQDYIRTAKAKGLRWRRVVLVHVLRNSLIPAVTITAPLLGAIITGSFIIESIFAIPGIGRYYVISVQARDYSVTMGITVLLAVIVIIANMIVDILYGVLDPRTRDARS